MGLLVESPGSAPFSVPGLAVLGDCSIHQQLVLAASSFLEKMMMPDKSFCVAQRQVIGWQLNGIVPS